MTQITGKIGTQTSLATESPGTRLVPPLARTARRHENRVLAGLPPTDLALLARHLHVVSFRPGAVLQHQDHPLEYVFFPHEGLVSMVAMTPNGETIEAASVGRGGAVCPVLKPGQTACLLTAVAQGSMRVSRIASAQVPVLQKESEAFDLALRACSEAILFQMRQNILCGGLHPVEQRLARWLLEAADRLESGVIPIPATQEHIAQRLGVRRTTVTLLASKLQDAGAIRWGRSRVEILDRPRLEAMACTCHATLHERMSSLLPSLPRGLLPERLD